MTTYTVIPPDCGEFGASFSFRSPTNGWRIFRDLASAQTEADRLNAHNCKSSQKSKSFIIINLDDDAYWDLNEHWVSSYCYGDMPPARGETPSDKMVRGGCGCAFRPCIEGGHPTILRYGQLVYALMRRGSGCREHNHDDLYTRGELAGRVRRPGQAA